MKTILKTTAVAAFAASLAGSSAMAEGYNNSYEGYDYSGNEGTGDLVIGMGGLEDAVSFANGEDTLTTAYRGAEFTADTWLGATNCDRNPDACVDGFGVLLQGRQEAGGLSVAISDGHGPNAAAVRGETGLAQHLVFDAGQVRTEYWGGASQ